MSIVDVEKKVESLEATVKESTKSPFNKVTIGTIITVVVLLFGTAGSWFTLRAEVNNLSEKVVKAEQIDTDQEKKIQTIEVINAEKNSDIKYIKEQVDALNDGLDKISRKLDKMADKK